MFVCVSAYTRVCVGWFSRDLTSPQPIRNTAVTFKFDGNDYQLSHGELMLYSGRHIGCVSLTTRGSGGTAHTCSGRHSQYS